MIEFFYLKEGPLCFHILRSSQFDKLSAFFKSKSLTV